MPLNILGIDCSTRWTNVGVAVDGKIVSDANMLIGRRQSSLLPALVTQIILNSGVPIESVDAISITSGPGYFTGIRVGLSYGCALAEGIGRKVVTVDSLTALAAPFLNGKRLVVPVIRARRGFVYSSMVSGLISNLISVAPPGFFPVSEVLRPDRFAMDSLTVFDDDRDLLDDISGLESSNNIISSIRGGYVALLGEAMFETAIAPSNASGQYLRGPEIGRKKYQE